MPLIGWGTNTRLNIDRVTMQTTVKQKVAAIMNLILASMVSAFIFAFREFGLHQLIWALSKNLTLGALAFRLIPIL